MRSSTRLPATSRFLISSCTTQHPCQPQSRGFRGQPARSCYAINNGCMIAVGIRAYLRVIHPSRKSSVCWLRNKGCWDAVYRPAFRLGGAVYSGFAVCLNRRLLLLPIGATAGFIVRKMLNISRGIYFAVVSADSWSWSSQRACQPTSRPESRLMETATTWPKT
jgi:hypothetical protein